MGYSALGMEPILKSLGEDIIGVEVGVCRGENIKALLDNCPNIKKIIGIDPWKAYKDKLNITQAQCDEWYLKAMENLKTYIAGNKAELQRMPSLEAAKKYRDELFDFVYIDGNHTFEMALADCRAWWPKIKPWGMLSGHDFRPKDKEVRRAVYTFYDEINSETIFKLQETEYYSWFIQKCE